VAQEIHCHPALVLLNRSTSSTDLLDYQLMGPGERMLELELKTKRQRYKGWSQYRPDLSESDLFILDELALRKIVDAGRYASLLVRDLPEDRWCLWSTADLVLTSKSRVARPLHTDRRFLKGKLLISLTEQSYVCDTLEEAVDRLVRMSRDVDACWNDIAPWPGGSTPAVGA
jgi:hypothetical protein